MKSKNIKSMGKIVQCSECAKTFPMDVNMIKECMNVNENGETMDVTYFACPHCNKVYIVLIMDKEAKRLKKKHDASVKMLNNYAKLKKELPESVKKQFEQTYAEYREYVKFLKEKYGKHFTLKEESNHDFNGEGEN